MATSATSSHVVLVGMMGAGKTSVGRQLAECLGRPYLDSDEQVEEHTGRTVPEIFGRGGEAAFRAEESRALAHAVSRLQPVVLSAAGGSVLAAGNRKVLQG